MNLAEAQELREGTEFADDGGQWRESFIISAFPDEKQVPHLLYLCWDKDQKRIKQMKHTFPLHLKTVYQQLTSNASSLQSRKWK
jgi:hypothetical protein